MEGKRMEMRGKGRKKKERKKREGSTLAILHFNQFGFVQPFSHRHAETMHFWPCHRNDVISILHGREDMKKIFLSICFIRL